MNNLIVFDMDGVLIDVSASYRDTVRKTAFLFFKDSKGAEYLKDPLFTLKDLSTVKQSGGLNNDWDLTHKVITLLMSRVKSGSSNTREDWDVSPLAEYLKTTETALSDLLETESGFSSAQADFYYRNDVGSGNIIKQIFQEVYLGKDLFKATYNMDCRFYKDDGYILREKLFIKPETLCRWAKNNTLAIATGRPKAEAVYPLKKHNIEYFEKIYSLDDCLKAEKEALERGDGNVSFSKPDPFMLDKLAHDLRVKKSNRECVEGHNFNNLFYVGDMPDDMLAANASLHNFQGIAVLYSAADKKSTLEKLKKAGASLIAETSEELDSIFK